jgi:ketosteroid isomerase-like protein
MSEPAATNKAIVEQFMATRFGQQNVARELMAPDATWYIPGFLPLSGLYRDRDEIFGVYLATHTDDFETVTSEVQMVIADGDHVVVEYHATGRTKKGRDYDTTYYYVFEVRDGLIRHVKQSLDTQYAQRTIYDD